MPSFQSDGSSMGFSSRWSCRDILLGHRTGHLPSDHMMRSKPLIGKHLKLFQRFWRKLVSKISEENSFKGLRKFVSKMLEEISFKDFGENFFQNFWKRVSMVLEEISFKDFGGN